MEIMKLDLKTRYFKVELYKKKQPHTAQVTWDSGAASFYYKSLDVAYALTSNRPSC